jgi:hypothetical protein
MMMVKEMFFYCVITKVNKRIFLMTNTTTTTTTSAKILGFPVQDLSGVKLKTGKMSVEKLSKMETYQGELRKLISQEMELNQLTQLEDMIWVKGSGIKLKKTRFWISILDMVAPTRPSNPCFWNWKGYFNLPIQSPFIMFEEVTHIASQYTPDLCKDFFYKVEGQKLTDQRKRKNIKKKRTNRKSAYGHASTAFWKEIIPQIGNEYFNQPLRPDFFDSFLAVGEISNFYYGILEEVYATEGSFAHRDETRNIEMVSIILAFYDMYQIEDCELVNNPNGDICPKLNEFDLSVITENKLLLTKLMERIDNYYAEKEIA